MAIQVQIGDTGQIAEFPDGTPNDVIQSALRQQMQSIAVSQQPETSFSQALIGQSQIDPRLAEAMGATSQETLNEREQALAALSPERRALIESINPAEAALIGAGRGLTTLGRAVGIADPETPFEKQAIEDIRTQQPVAVTGGEIAGEALPFVAPGLGIAAIPARAGQVAAVAGLGALETGLIARGQGADIGQQIFSAGIGGTVAGALDLAIPVIGRIGGKVIRRVLGKAPDGAVIDAAGKPSREFLAALKESGQSIDDVVKEAQEELTRKAVDPKQAARKAFLESQGIDPTKAQVSRTADDFMAQQEAAKTSGAVRESLERQDALLTTRFNNKVLETGGDAANQSASVADFITDKAAVLDQEISDMYNVARQRMPSEKNIKFNRLTASVREMFLSDQKSGGNISAVIGDMRARGIINKKGKLVGSVDVESSEGLRQFMNSLHDEKNPFGNMVLRKLKDSLDDDVFSVAGKDVFNKARAAKTSYEKGLSRAKLSKFDSRKANLVRDVLENKVDPDLIVDKVVFSKAWRPSDLDQLKKYLLTDDAGKAAFDDMRAEVMQKIQEKSFAGPVGELGSTQAVTRNRLEKAIKAVGPKKLDILFSGKERKFLNDMLEVAKLREPVGGTFGGLGPSAQAIIRLERKLKDLPMMGKLFEVVDIEGRMALRARPTQIKQAQKLLPPQLSPAIALPAAAATQQEQNK